MHKLIAQDFDFELPKHPVDDNDEQEKTQADIQARILLYSLDTQSIRRAGQVLGEVFPRAKIEISSEEVCTTRLKAATRNADWVVFVADVATQQAFFCIKAALRPEAVLLQVGRSGTTRIVERVIRQSQHL